MLSGEQLCRIMDEIRQAFILSEDAEITMEANPGTVSLEQMKLCRKASINQNKSWTSVHGTAGT